jgi:hypothetical protein
MIMAATVTILGAGATKSCGGPLTNEILPGMLQYKSVPETAEKLSELELFLSLECRSDLDDSPSGGNWDLRSAGTPIDSGAHDQSL